MTKILIIDNNDLDSNRIKLQIDSITGCYVFKEIKNSLEAIDYLRHTKILPDIIFLEVVLQKLDGVSTMDIINENFPKIKVICFTNSCTKSVINSMFACGAMGFLLKEGIIEKSKTKNLEISHSKTFELKVLNPKQFIEIVIRCVLNNESYIDERLSYDISKRDALVASRLSTKKLIEETYQLTQREKDIIALNMFEINYKNIGKVLNISDRTVETNITNLCRKFNVGNGKYGVLAFCLRHGYSRIAFLC